MSNENVVSMVDSLTSGDNVAAQDAFKGALTDKIGQALDDKRQTVANDWLNAGDELGAIGDEAHFSTSVTAGAQDEFDAVAAQVDAGVDDDSNDEPFEIDDDQVEED
jgi:hypothetical protein